MLIDAEPFVQNWPGKSAIEPGGSMHPAAYHLLDVAAVSKRLMTPLDLTPARRDALLFLVALHDLGKIGAQFRAMVEGKGRQAHAHWEVSEAHLLQNEEWLCQRLQVQPRPLRQLIAATAGHHGRPPRAGYDDLARMRRAAGHDAGKDARAAIEALAELWPDAELAGLDLAEAKSLSWWLPGLVATADWIGSNAEWFPPASPEETLADYLARALESAERAVAAAGLATPAPSDAPLFDFALRPMQSAAAEIALRDGPILALIEDETGAGKTEAALILAQRMMIAGKGLGLFMALPTMATADAMFLRMRDAVGRKFAGGPSLTLAHGRAGLSVAFRDLVGDGRPNPDEPGCSPWLAENRRRALLADVGVGTIDQALLGVLPTRHACMRLYGLSAKIFIVDEVHEMGDPYMAAELAQLLRAQAGQGGSAILLSATLPLDLRARLMAAFEQGAGREPPEVPGAAYPALTVAGGATAAPQVRTSETTRGPVAVKRLESEAAALDLLAKWAGKGAACVWVRNAVDPAIDAVQALRARGVPSELLHARFALCDRKRHESAALARFGKAGQGRAGWVLVATQVVESSLDLDFDVMISDLAPMAALIQRAGRLWRHMAQRPATARPVPGPALHVLAPDPDGVDDDGWLRLVLGAGAYVYPLDIQWRTARVLFKTGRISAPEGLRKLIEAAHGKTIPVPPALSMAELRTEGADHAARNRGEANVVALDLGFRRGAGGWEDAEFPTRLGRLQRRLLLVRATPSDLVPWSGDIWDADGEQLSEVQAAASRLDRFALPD